jgi:glyoxylase-like metal-dependent hydrolase (beta-lactamase superfamily II)
MEAETMPFLTEPEPERDAMLEVLPGISRIVANNPGPMTYFGTNTWVFDGPDGTIVLDPGPEDHPEHVDAIMRHTDGKIALIVVSHTHHDHVGAVPALKAASGARTVGFHTSATDSFTADIRLGHGEAIAGMTALHTPGHRSDHLCFSMPWRQETILFSADHVMSWSTSIVSPPDGNMTHYFASLKLLLDRDEAAYLPGHGPLLRQPQDLVRQMLTHRLLREQAIVKTLSEGPADTRSVVEKLYRGLNPRLFKAAERSVLAHLLKLEEDGKAAHDGEIWRTA